ncbi:hypothetical protein [Flavobacterium sp.]|uniref:LGFP repeat-containing protein n=1 Tax=Flavobacterium sp. TaxID=239 RepID=UPI0026218DDF|nr:hypothetical protein [Flavobacterium sp.]
MKKIISVVCLVLLANSFASAQAGKSKLPDDARQQIIGKAKKLNLKSDDGFTINYQPLSVADDGKFEYYALFSNGNASVFCKPGAKEAFAVWGDILMAYNKLMTGDVVKDKNGKGRGHLENQNFILGAPVSDEFRTPNKEGAGQHFEGGSIYWSPGTGAHEIHGAIKDKWAALGWENSFLGFPVTDEKPTPDGYGRFNFFEGGAIYFHPHLGTFAIPKGIIEIWKREGWEKGKLGYPVGDEIVKNNNSVQYFEFGAVISVKAGPYQVIFNSMRSTYGLYTKWKATGGVDSYLGDLVTPNKNYPKMYRYYFAEFQKGFIYENPNASNAFVIKKGPFFDYYASKKWETGYLGLPVSDEIPSRDNFTIQKFEGGTIIYNPSTGAYEKK